MLKSRFERNDEQQLLMSSTSKKCATQMESLISLLQTLLLLS